MNRMCYVWDMDCLQCGKKIPTTVRVRGKENRVFWRRKFCFDCSPWGKKGAAVRTKYAPNDTKACSECGATAPAKEFKRNGLCKGCLAKKARDKRLAMKKRCVEFLGGKCKQCGYSKCLAALDFHHRDHHEKEFEIGRKKWKDFAALERELRKCDLLCRNCHAEVHFNNLS